jgi:hypothetical protein
LDAHIGIKASIPSIITTAQANIIPHDNDFTSSIADSIMLFDSYKSSCLSVDGFAPSIAKQDTTEEPEHYVLSVDAIVLKGNSITAQSNDIVDDNDIEYSDVSPWRLDSLLRPKSRQPKDTPDVRDGPELTSTWDEECIEVDEIGQIFFDETVLFEEEFPVFSVPNIECPEVVFFDPEDEDQQKDAQPPMEPPVRQMVQESFHHPELTALGTSTTMLKKKNSSFSSCTKSKSKRPLGLRYLFGSRVRKMNFFPWKRRGKRNYENMKKLDDPSSSPDTITTTAQTLQTDCFSFQGEMSIQTSSNKVHHYEVVNEQDEERCNTLYHHDQGRRMVAYT